jgi:hypothetical protein
LLYGLGIVGAILLAAKFYFLSELLVLLALMAILFLVGTGVLLFIVLLQEAGRWSLQGIRVAKRRALSTGESLAKSRSA